MAGHELFSSGYLFRTLKPGARNAVERLNLDAWSKIQQDRYRQGTELQNLLEQQRKLILTSYTIDVRKPSRPDRTHSELTTIGGKIGDLTLHVAGMPVFAKDESAVVFVENTGAYSTVVGLAQGKFAVSNGEVSNDVIGLDFPDGSSAGQPKCLSRHSNADQTFPGSVDALKVRIPFSHPCVLGSRSRVPRASRLLTARCRSGHRSQFRTGSTNGLFGYRKRKRV
jgi:hypothetical protein